MIDIDVIETSSHVVCRPSGELDAYGVGRLRERVADLAAHPRLVIDLAAVPFLDSAGLGTLIAIVRATKDEGGKVAVACDRDNVLRLLHTAGFDRIVEVVPTVDAAVESFEAD